MASKFSFTNVLFRWVLAAALVFGTFNPSQYCFVNWVRGTEFGPVVALVGIALLIAWIVFLRATFLAIGWLGFILLTAFFGCVVWLFVDQQWLKVDSAETMTWLVLVVLSLVLAVGLSWSHLRRQLSGQVSVDDVED